jgi:nucleoporin NUP82
MSTQNRLLSDNSTSFHLDPLYADRVYVSHAFGIHILDMRRWLKSILGALKGNQKRGELERVLKEETGTEVTHVLNTFSVPHQSVSVIYSIVTPN